MYPKAVMADCQWIEMSGQLNHFGNSLCRFGNDVCTVGFVVFKIINFESLQISIGVRLKEIEYGCT
jgi:hypothetical protein